MTTLQSSGTLTVEASASPVTTPTYFLFTNVNALITDFSVLTVTLQDADVADATTCRVLNAIPRTAQGGSILVLLAGTPSEDLLLVYQVAPAIGGATGLPLGGDVIVPPSVKAVYIVGATYKDTEVDKGYLVANNLVCVVDDSDNTDAVGYNFYITDAITNELLYKKEYTELPGDFPPIFAYNLGFQSITKPIQVSVSRIVEIESAENLRMESQLVTAPSNQRFFRDISIPGVSYISPLVLSTGWMPDIQQLPENGVAPPITLDTISRTNGVTTITISTPPNVSFGYYAIGFIFTSIENTFTYNFNVDLNGMYVDVDGYVVGFPPIPPIPDSALRYVPGSTYSVQAVVINKVPYTGTGAVVYPPLGINQPVGSLALGEYTTGISALSNPLRISILDSPPYPPVVSIHDNTVVGEVTFQILPFAGDTVDNYRIVLRAANNVVQYDEFVPVSEDKLYLIPNVVPGGAYQYIVSALNKFGEGEPTIGTFTAVPGEPGAPLVLNAIYTTNPVQGFDCYFSAAAVSGAPTFAGVTATATQGATVVSSGALTSPGNNSLYRYIFTDANIFTLGGEWDIVVTVAPTSSPPVMSIPWRTEVLAAIAPPSNLSLTNITGTSAELTWEWSQQSYTNPVAFTLYWNSGFGGSANTSAIPGTNRSFTLTNLWASGVVSVSISADLAGNTSPLATITAPTPVLDFWVVAARQEGGGGFFRVDLYMNTQQTPDEPEKPVNIVYTLTNRNNEDLPLILSNTTVIQYVPPNALSPEFFISGSPTIVASGEYDLVVTATQNGKQYQSPSYFLQLTGTPISSPTNVNLTLVDGVLTGTWDNIPVADGYTIGWYNNGKLVDSTRVTVPTVSYTPTVKGNYYFTVGAYGNGTYSDTVTSNTVAVTTDVTPPSQPTGLDIQFTGGLRLSWDVVPEATSYTVSWYVDNDFLSTDIVPAGQLPYPSSFFGSRYASVPTGLYYATVVATNAGGSSAASTSSPITVSQAAPIITGASITHKLVDSVDVWDWHVVWSAMEGIASFTIRLVSGYEIHDIQVAASGTAAVYGWTLPPYIYNSEDPDAGCFMYVIANPLPGNNESFIRTHYMPIFSSVTSNSTSITTVWAPPAPLAGEVSYTPVVSGTYYSSGVITGATTNTTSVSYNSYYPKITWKNTSASLLLLEYYHQIPVVVAIAPPTALRSTARFHDNPNTNTTLEATWTKPLDNAPTDTYTVVLDPAPVSGTAIVTISGAEGSFYTYHIDNAQPYTFTVFRTVGASNSVVVMSNPSVAITNIDNVNKLVVTFGSPPPIVSTVYFEKQGGGTVGVQLEIGATTATLPQGDVVVGDKWTIYGSFYYGSVANLYRYTKAEIMPEPTPP